jgi:hypothetical protein
MDAACEASSIRSHLIFRPEQGVFGIQEFILTQKALTRADQAILP